MIKFKKTLIVEQSREYVLQIKEMLHGYIDQVEFAYDGKAAIDIYNHFQPDLVMIEAILPKYDGFTLLEQIVDDDIFKIITTCVNNELIIKKAFDLGADYVFVKPYEKELFLRRLFEVVKYKKSMSDELNHSELKASLKNRISALLKKLGIPANMLGYEYIREALLAMCTEVREETIKYRKLYEKLAKKFDTNHGCIERNIRHAIEIAATRGDPDAMNHYFSYSMDSEKGKPTNGEFLATLADALKLEYE